MVARRVSPKFGAVLAVAFLGVVIGGPADARAAGQPAASGDLSWRADARPFRLTFEQGHRTILGQAGGDQAGPGGRMAYALTDGSTHRLTDLERRRSVDGGTTYTVATDEPGRTAKVTVRRTPRGLRVAWSFSPSDGVAQVYEALTGSDDEHFLGGGANFIFTDLRHRVLFNKAEFVGASTLGTCNKSGAPSPFFLSSKGYGVFPDTPSIGRLAFPNASDQPPHCLAATAPPPCPVQLGQPDRTQLCFKADHLSYEVYAGSSADIVRSYSARAGFPTLPPPRQFALTFWRDINRGGQPEVLDDVKQLQAAGIPLSTVWIDNPWEISTAPPGQWTNTAACNGTLQFDPGQFPDPKAMIDELHSRGVHLGLWISPFVRPTAADKPCPDAGYPPGSFAADTGRTDRLDIDYTNPAARAHFEAKLEKVLSLGVDMIKGDRAEETDFERARFAAGPGTDVQNPYPVLYAESTARVLRKLWGEDYTMLFRAGYTGQPATLNGHWAADARTTFDGLRLSLRRGLNSWLSGHPVWGSDTGGYAPAGDPQAPSSSLFVRWSQMSAVSPVFEVGGGGRNATPWLYDAKTVDRFRDAVLLHYALFPYLQALAERAARTGEPITRPLAFDHPDDEEAWAADQEMLIGADLLAAPVTADRAEADGAAERPTPVDVYLPEGSWIDLYTGEVVEGGRHVVRESTLDDFPLYLRVGGAIGFNLRADGVWDEPWALNDLDRTDRSGWLLAPGEGVTRAANAYGGEVEAIRRGDRLAIELDDAPEETQVLLAGVQAVRDVRVDGRSVTGEPGADLRGERTGWTTRSGPFGGVLLKLQPRGGDSVVTLTLG